MSSFGRKRAPFTPADARENRADRDAAPRSSSVNKRRTEPSSSVFSKTGLRAPVSSILVENGVRSKSRSKSRSRQQPAESHHQQSLLSSPSRSSSTSGASSNDATRARVYKAEAYEAKVRIASQDQRIGALQAELEEVKFFQMMEQVGNNEAADREKKSKEDAELIEALAQELETMEKDTERAHMRVRELEKSVLESTTSENKISATHYTEKEQWEKMEIELKRQLERQQREVNKAKKDTRDGIFLVKELDGALKKARAEKDEAKSQCTELLGEMKEMQDDSERMAVVKELEVALKSVQSERDVALVELSAARDEANELKEKRMHLEKSNEDLQSTIERVQTQSGTKVGQIKQAVLEAQLREERLEQENKNLSDDNQRLVKESEELDEALEELANQMEVQKKELSMKTAETQELEKLHATNISNLKETNDDLLKSSQSHWETRVNNLQNKLAVAHTKSQEFEGRESNYRSEIKSLKESVKELKMSMINDMGVPYEELIDGIETDKTKLKSEKDELLQKLQIGLEIHKKTTLALDAKTVELNTAKSNLAGAQIENEAFDTLKKDYASAVELSISRGKKIQEVENDVGTYKSQLAKVVQKIKKMEEKKSEASVLDQILHAEVTTLRAKRREAEATISALNEELYIQSTKISRSEKLKHDLAKAQMKNEESQSKILTLEEALRDMQVALKTVSSHKLSPRRSHMSKEEKRKQIEEHALKAYCSQRM